MLPSELSEFEAYPDVLALVKNYLDPPFNDLRGLLKLPLPNVGITGGCNFASAALLCNLISGISVVLYTPTNPKVCKRGDLFKGLMLEFFPWDDKDELRAEKTDILYGVVRNPLTHALGLLETNSVRTVIAKSPLGETQIEHLEKSEARPAGVPPPIACDRSTGNVVSVSGLYWGVFQMLRRLTTDRNQMDRAPENMRKRYHHAARPA